MEIGTKLMVEDFQTTVVIERDERGRQWRGNRRTLIWGVTQFRKTLIEEGNSKCAGTVVLVRDCLVLVDGIGWGAVRFLVPGHVDGGALKWSGLTTKFRLGGKILVPGPYYNLSLLRFHPYFWEIYKRLEFFEDVYHWIAYRSNVWEDINTQDTSQLYDDNDWHAKLDPKVPGIIENGFLKDGMEAYKFPGTTRKVGYLIRDFSTL
ncbi:hypothetical protein CASFOL_028965 [Castilleja foliolosa]